MSEKDWRQVHATESEMALEHPLVKGVVDEYVDNMRHNFGGIDLSKGLPRYGLIKVMRYVAQVAAAQALGFDPELLRMSDDEATAEQMKLMQIFAEAGRPIIVVTEDVP